MEKEDIITNETTRSNTKTWRKRVLERDNFSCKICGDCTSVVAHHIKSWAGYPELRVEESNGITLCQMCHIGVHKGWLNIK